ncbi:hypothetical protein Moror_16853 [Moniliophthora roreri MCA 2997]|uniref:Uncharacterized protein n=1 Tax=Moniliophthora roreri (strain MCA 2997) TaxID=1381753 RepID=V2X7J2_MONRO|nr:hypothetical protein Moror_16853 [Moniliophthora roreri MCA 2997]
MAPIHPRAGESSASHPNLPLIIALSIAGILILLTAIPAGIYIRRQFWPRRSTFRATPLDQLTTSPNSRFTEKHRNGDAQGVVPLMSYHRRPASGHDDSLVLYDPYESYHSKVESPRNHIPYHPDACSYRGSCRDAEGRGLLSHSRAQSQVYTSPRLSSEPATRSPFMEEITLKDLPPFLVSGTQIKGISPPWSQAGDHTASADIEVTLVAPGQGSAQYPRPLPPPGSSQSASEVPPETNEDSDSDSDTDSQYSQVSASTRHHLAFSQGLSIPLPSAFTSRHDEELRQAPTRATSSLLITRDNEVPNRQLLGVSQIEPSNSIDPPPRDAEGEDLHKAYLTHGTATRNLFGVREEDDTLPNQFKYDVASVPASNPTAPTERRPNLQLPMFSADLQPLRISKRGSLTLNKGA